jgi:AcrR family transcriptional regulator
VTETDVRTRRERLVAATIEALDELGPEAVTTRKLAERAGTTTMGLYSEFGSLGGLMSEVVDAGFEELAAAFDAVEHTEDPVADLATLTGVYRARALAQPHLYAVMFGAAPLGGHRRTGAEIDQIPIDTFEVCVRAVDRAMRAGRFSPGDAFKTAGQVWSSLHGVVMLEIAGMLQIVGDPLTEILLPLWRTLFVGLGDDPDRVDASLRAARLP